uniref:MAPK regulated corepressor interacting protein 1 n=1 Tax=Propithecus coquereli TaxID=379532 RepID=A0A2K6FWZ0_PROCO
MTRWVSGRWVASAWGRAVGPCPAEHPWPCHHTPAPPSSPVSRVVYNGKRNSSPRSPSSSEIFTPAHEENVRFIYEAWQGVERDLRSQMSGSERGLVEEYVEKVPNPSLKSEKASRLSHPCPWGLDRDLCPWLTTLSPGSLQTHRPE